MDAPVEVEIGKGRVAPKWLPGPFGNCMWYSLPRPLILRVCYARHGTTRDPVFLPEERDADSSFASKEA